MIKTDTPLHASCVAMEGRAALILGKSGSGKSALALQIMAFGGQLVADDRVVLTRIQDQLVASCPPQIRGLIEARGMGLLRATPAEPTLVACVIDLDQTEQDRLPHPREFTVNGITIPLFYRVDGIHFASAISQFLRCGQSTR